MNRRWGGLAMDNLALGIGIGVALGAGFGATASKPPKGK
jgi:hypothetical protein